MPKYVLTETRSYELVAHCITCADRLAEIAYLDYLPEIGVEGREITHCIDPEPLVPALPSAACKPRYALEIAS